MDENGGIVFSILKKFTLEESFYKFLDQQAVDIKIPEVCKS
jgi:hypothetical protein